MAKEPVDIQGLFPEVESIQDAKLREGVVDIWNEYWAASAYERIEDVPVSLKIAYPQVKHLQGVLKAALAVATLWQEVHGVHFNFDHLIAGALLMDVSKMVEMAPQGEQPAKTELGRLLPHAVYAAHSALARNLPLPVVHILVSHSPNSGKAPETPEARLLDWLDQADISAFGFDIWQRRVTHFQP